MRTLYPSLLNAKFWLKTWTPAGRLASLSELDLADSTPETESAPAP